MERQVSALWAEVQEIRQALEPLRRDIRKQRRDFNRLDGELNSVKATLFVRQVVGRLWHDATDACGVPSFPKAVKDGATSEQLSGVLGEVTRAKVMELMQWRLRSHDVANDGAAVVRMPNTERTWDQAGARAHWPVYQSLRENLRTLE